LLAPVPCIPEKAHHEGVALPRERERWVIKINSELVIVELFPKTFSSACGCEEVELVIVLGERATDTPYLQLQHL